MSLFPTDVNHRSYQSTGQSTGQTVKRLLVAAMITALSACGGGGGDDTLPPVTTADANTPTGVEVSGNPSTLNDGEDVVDVSDPTQCNAATQKQWAYDNMQGIYLFADQVPVVDPQSFDSAADLVRQLRFEERDPFSNVSNATTSNLQFQEGREFGVGLFARIVDNDLRVGEVVSDSPFGMAGIERGDILISVDGLQVDDQELASTFAERVIGTPDNPATSSWQIRKRDSGEIVELEITSAEYDIDTVLERSVFPNPATGTTTGYMVFSRFLATSSEELNDAARFFQEQNITDLILDLRYNGGGRVSIAAQLASFIGGSGLAGQQIYEYQFNDNNTEENYTLTFDEFFDEEGLPIENEGLSRVIILTTGATASASEIVIAGLQPYIDVVTIGGLTSGKPYISRSLDRCDERLNIIQAEGFNANGVSVFGGVEPTCVAADDLTRDFGTNRVTGETEGFLAAALDYVESGACATPQLANADSITGRSATRVDDSVLPDMTRQPAAFAE